MTGRAFVGTSGWAYASWKQKFYPADVKAKDLLRHYAVSDIASSVYRDRFGCWGFLDLWRIRPAEPFMERDVEYLRAIVLSVTEALRRAQAETFHIVQAPRVPGGPAVLVLAVMSDRNRDGRVAWATVRRDPMYCILLASENRFANRGTDKRSLPI